MQNLARKGVVQSFKGRGGGFVLGRPAAKIAVADVVRIFQGEISLHDCLLKKRICPDVKTYPLRKAIGRLERRLVKDLGALSLASILGDTEVRRKARKTGGRP
jgi:Rrf2 family protein